MLNAHLVLHRPASADVTEVALLHPQADALVTRWTTAWDDDGLAPWIVRTSEHGPIIGTGGVLRVDGHWLLGWRLLDAVLPSARVTAEYALQLSRRAIAAARRLRPDLPIVLLTSSAAEVSVAERLGLAPTARDSHVYADRALRDVIVTAA